MGPSRVGPHSQQVQQDVDVEILNQNPRIKKPVSNHSTNIFLYVILLTMGLGSMGFTGYAIYKELQFQDVVNGYTAFPTILHCEFFAGRTFAPNISDNFRNYLKRDIRTEGVFMAYMGFFLLVTIPLMIVCNTAYKLDWWFLLCSFGFLINIGLMIQVVHRGSEHQYENAFHYLEVYSKTKEGSRTPRHSLEIKVLQAVTYVCRRYPSPVEGSAITIGSETCGLNQLSELGFCQHYNSKIAAIFLACILTATCVAIFIISCVCCDKLPEPPAEISVQLIRKSLQRSAGHKGKHRRPHRSHKKTRKRKRKEHDNIRTEAGQDTDLSKTSVQKVNERESHINHGTRQQASSNVPPPSSDASSPPPPSRKRYIRMTRVLNLHTSPSSIASSRSSRPDHVKNEIKEVTRDAWKQGNNGVEWEELERALDRRLQASRNKSNKSPRK